MNSKIMIFFQFMYKYFQTSFFFWIYLCRGLFIYSLVPALCTLFLVLKDINAGVDDEKNVTVKQLFKKYYTQHKNSRLMSFIYMLIFILIYTSLYFINKESNEGYLILIIVFIYILFMTLLMLIYSTVFIAFKEMDKKNGNFLAFLSIFKNPVASVALIVILILLNMSINFNFAFFLAFGPFLFGLGVIFSLYKLINESGSFVA
ncbi:hypothetical protein [Metabacillus halosaccharovorans]|uniref:DUF624 domain-containing protein n=1 Tax=Metabacillus halosaccharovorans TaxID=930124 RepID=A0ABT3DPF0_9BACI|nr:hypothetical protein [Metabacillus halosaccharovorans]MCV9888706.1 hypothetical protein [Metabacillus halosaccharovorans]